jgi:probable F420-dependent oxidoreductase
VKFSIEMSVRGEAANPDAIVDTAQAAERAGFALLGYTDHPAPSKKWLQTGGHATFDPFGALCFLAAATTTIRLMTYLVVLPYRNPLLLAKSVATIDRLSGGRFTMVAGTGYLRSEFSALGRSFDDRNQLFEEAVAVVRSVYQDDEFLFEGTDFVARGVISDPKPLQLPHPPIWIGGSSRTSRRRVARYGSGWAPLLTSPDFARTVRTGQMSTNEEVAAAVADLHALLRAEGRDPAEVSIQLDGFGSTDMAAEAAIERAQELQGIGVTHVLVRAPRGTTAQVVESLEAFGEQVIAKTNGAT